MPRLLGKLPGYCHHKASGQAGVTLGAETITWGRGTTVQPFDVLPNLIVISLHPGQVEARNIKRHAKRFAGLTKPRQQLRQLLIDQRLGA